MGSGAAHGRSQGSGAVDRIRRLGENRTQRFDLRVVAATNRPLGAEAAAGRFRRDLLYRLNVLWLTAPPLRDRGPDIARFTDHYWKDIASAAGSRANLARETVTAVGAHPWPGNVRELQNVLANLTVTGPRYGAVGPDALPAAYRRGGAAERRPTLAEAREDLERTMVRDALGRHDSVARAAGELGITRQGLSKLMAVWSGHPQRVPWAWRHQPRRPVQRRWPSEARPRSTAASSRST